MDQKLVVPSSRLAFNLLDGREILQIHIDVGEIFILRLGFFEHLNDNGQSFLPQDLNRIDRRVQDRYLGLSPLLGL